MSEHAARTPAIPDVLPDPTRNHGVAFTPAEQEELGLTGRLPAMSSGYISAGEFNRIVVPARW